MADIDRCPDCENDVERRKGYRILVPRDRTGKYPEPEFTICEDCWDRMVGYATMGLLR